MARVRTKAVVHLDKLRRNLQRAKDRLSEGCDMIMVVKGDAYRHGIQGVYENFRSFGIKHYAVSCWEEARVLRDAGAKDEMILYAFEMASGYAPCHQKNSCRLLCGLGVAYPLYAALRSSQVL